MVAGDAYLTEKLASSRRAYIQCCIATKAEVTLSVTVSKLVHGSLLCFYLHRIWRKYRGITTDFYNIVLDFQ